jgi:peptide/nickel transport system substrate-binding protein
MLSIAGHVRPSTRATAPQQPSDRRARWRSLPGVVATVCVVGGAIAATGCGSQTPAGSDSAAGTPAKGGNDTFVVTSDNVGTSIDPALASDQPSLQSATAAYETLVKYDPEAKKLQPALATAWKVAGDGKTVTLTLRDGVTFHDGSKLTAAGVVASLKRTVAIGKGESFLLSAMRDAASPDDKTVEVHLKTPDADFLYGLTRIFIVSGKAIQQHGGSDQGQQWFSSHDAGSGPYEITAWQPSHHYTLEQFSEYWGGWSGNHVKRFEFNQADSPATQVLNVEQGKADFANGVPIDNAEKLKESSDSQVQTFPGSPFYIMLNTGKVPLDDVRVRQALSLAVPYDDVVQKIMYGDAQAMKGPIPPWMPGADPSLPSPTTDLEQAKSLLEEAGYGPSHRLSLKLTYFPGWSFEETIVTQYQYQLKQLGVDLNIKALPWPTFTQQVADPKTRPDMGTIAVYVPIPSPLPTLTASFDPASDGGWAYWGYDNPAVTKLLHQAQATIDEQQRQDLYHEAQQKLTQDYAAIWLMEMPDIFVLAKNVHGLVHDPSWGVLLNCYGVYKS